MGRYFGIGNSTKKQVVSSYWKGDEWCDCYQVVHQMHWDRSDKIYSSCHDTYCRFEYNAESNKMDCVEIDSADLDSSNSTDSSDSSDSSNSEELTPVENKKYGFDGKLSDEKICGMINHVPDWDGNLCRTCYYTYDGSKLKKYEKKFDPVFFMN